MNYTNTHKKLKKGLMFNKYKFPLNLFLIFEKLNPVVYTSECLTSNHYVLFIPKEWLFPVAKVLRNESFFSCNYLVEHSSIDAKNYQQFSKNFNFFFKKNQTLTYYIFYFYNIKTKLTLFVNTDSMNNIPSLDSLYSNANWLERESSELFNINYTHKKDVRNLLLDYSRNDYPFLKEYPTEGYFDIYYDFFEDQLQYVESEYVEL